MDHNAKVQRDQSGLGMRSIPWDNDEQLILLCKEFLQVRQELEDQYRSGKKGPVSLQELASHFRLSLEQIVELQDFAENHLGTFERDHILGRAGGFCTMDGDPTDPDNSPLLE